MKGASKRAQQLLANVEERLRKSVDPIYKKGQTNFFKEKIDPWGVRMPVVRDIARSVYRDIKTWPMLERNWLAEQLWRSGKLESSVIVIYAWRSMVTRLPDACDLDVFERWLDKYVHSWVQTDGLSTWLIAQAIKNRPADIERLQQWTTAKNRWKRRSAAVSLLQEAKAGHHTAEIFDIALRLRSDRDDMVEKGIGWLLKESYPKQPEAVVEFLLTSGVDFSRTTIRYAAEKMSASDREKVIKRGATKAAARG